MTRKKSPPPARKGRPQPVRGSRGGAASGKTSPGKPVPTKAVPGKAAASQIASSSKSPPNKANPIVGLAPKAKSTRGRKSASVDRESGPAPTVAETDEDVLPLDVLGDLDESGMPMPSAASDSTALPDGDGSRHESELLTVVAPLEALEESPLEARENDFPVADDETDERSSFHDDEDGMVEFGRLDRDSDGVATDAQPEPTLGLEQGAEVVELADFFASARGEVPVDVSEGPDVTAAVEGDLLGDDESANDTEAFLKNALEAILFVSDRPLTVKDVAKALQLDRRRAEEILNSLRDDYANKGLRIDAVADGYAFRSHPRVAEYVRAFLEQKPVKLSRAQLETLAIVAYRQPITRPEADDIRGVDCGPVLRGLLERDLIRVIGKKDEPGRPMLYGTTPAFLELFGLKSLEELPTLKEFTELNEESRRKFEDELGEVAPIGLADFGLSNEDDNSGAVVPPTPAGDDGSKQDGSLENSPGSDAELSDVPHAEDASSRPSSPDEGEDEDEKSDDEDEDEDDDEDEKSDDEDEKSDDEDEKSDDEDEKSDDDG